jgi:hypothetical protein
LSTLSGVLSSAPYGNGNGDGVLGPEYFLYPTTTACNIGDIILSVNGYGGTGAALPADGRTLPIASHTSLFSLLGTTFGGNGSTDFNLPDLRPFAPRGLQYSICIEGNFPARN